MGMVTTKLYDGHHQVTTKLICCGQKTHLFYQKKIDPHSDKYMLVD